MHNQLVEAKSNYTNAVEAFQQFSNNAVNLRLALSNATNSSVHDSYITNIWNEKLAEMNEAARRQERAAAESGRPSEDYLRAIISKPLPVPKVEDGFRVDLDAINSVSQRLEEENSKKAAKETLVKRLSSTNDAKALSFGAPIADYYVGVFIDALKRLAVNHGDRVVSTYTNAEALSKMPQDRDWANIGLEKNQAWAFKVYFRQQANASEYNWEIYGPATYFTAKIRGGSVSYELVGTTNTWSGELESFGQTRLIPVFTWMLGTEKAAHPLTK